MSGLATICDPGKELFIQDYVSVDSVTGNLAASITLNDDVGRLVIVQHPEPLGICVEWQCEQYERGTEDSGWEIIFDGQPTGKTRTKSESSNNRNNNPAIRVQVNKLQSYKISRSKQQISLMVPKDGFSCKFNFQRGTVNHFVGSLKTLVSTTQSHHDKKLFFVSDKNLEVSFAHLESFPNDLPDARSSTWQQFQERPVESAMNAFAKLNLKLFYNNGEEDAVINERLSSSLHSEEVTVAKEYEDVSLPPRKLSPRIPPLTPAQWASFFNENGVIADSDFVKTVISHGGVDPTIRKDVWMFLLDVYPWNSTLAEREKLKLIQTQDYFRMKTQWETITKEQEERFSDYKERKSLIEKDVSRTDRTLNFYADDNNRNLEQLRDILMTYVMFNFDLGYVQGMSDILSPIFFLIQDEVDSFWCFTAAVEKLIKNFDIDQAGMKEQLQQLFQLLTTVEPELAQYLQKQDSSNMFFCFRWLLVWFKREFTFDDIYILWETIWALNLCPNYQLLICIAILDSEKEIIMKNDYGFTEILKHVNELSNKINLSLTLQKALAIYEQLASCPLAPNATRKILGLPLVPEPEVTEIKENGVGNGKDNFPAVNYRTDTEELGFETSINLAYN